jgi:hypothetical protein
MPTKLISLSKQIKLPFAAVCLWALLALSGCSGSNKLPDVLNTYAERLGNVLEIEIESESYLLMPFPNRTSMAQQLPEIDMNLREFYGINNCPIKQLIAQRNTALGKIHLPSQRFKYEVEVINTLQQCVKTINRKSVKNTSVDQALEKELALIEKWLSAKTSNYPHNWSNLVTQSEETYLAFTQSDGFLSGDKEEPISLALIDLRFLLSLNQVSESDDKIVTVQDVEELESHLQSVRSHRFYVKYWRSIMFIEQRLNGLNAMLSASLPTFQCHSTSNKTQFDILRNVFTKYFIQGVQPIASALNNYQYQLNPIFEEIVNHPDLPSDFKSGIAHRHQTLVNDYENSMKNHIQLWQAFFARCSVNPESLVSATSQ